jgi:hypothetical protein
LIQKYCFKSRLEEIVDIMFWLWKQNQDWNWRRNAMLSKFSSSM